FTITLFPYTTLFRSRFSNHPLLFCDPDISSKTITDVILPREECLSRVDDGFSRRCSRGSEIVCMGADMYTQAHRIVFYIDNDQLDRKSTRLNSSHVK